MNIDQCGLDESLPLAGKSSAKANSSLRLGASGRKGLKLSLVK